MADFINVRKLIANKNPKLLKWLPGFLVRGVEKFVHQDEINAFMIYHEQSDMYTFCEAVLKRFNFQLGIHGLENIPKQPEKIIFASNHPLGGMDAISIVHVLRDTRPDIKFIVNDLLMQVRHLSDRFVGINLVGKKAAESLHKVEEQFAEGTATFIFPAGLVSRKTKGEIRDLEWKKTFVSKAKKYQLPVIPVHIGGGLTNRFYRLANFRKFLGIKLNIEMFFLVDELFRQEDMKIDIFFGEPIPPDTFDKTKNDKAWAEWVKEQAYRLKAN
ncbi:MAG: 1-acyl-sn-glycerol-3-phosphate acyltransferase [Bacteroidota bacterium]